MHVPPKNSLNRSSILRLKSEIQSLFSDGRREYMGILKVIWTIDKVENDQGVKIFVAVPKKNIRKAVKRNLLKRRIKEALRLNLNDLKELSKENNLYIKIGVVYSKNYIEEYNKIEQKIVLSLQKIYSLIYESIKQ